MARQVSVTDAAELMKQGWRYLDVRSVPEFEQGHPAGAANVPLLHAQDGGRMVSNPDFEAVMTANFPRDQKLLVGCKTAGRSAQATAILEALGYREVILVRGGYTGERDMYGRATAPGWAAAGLPTATADSEGTSYAALQGPRP